MAHRIGTAPLTFLPALRNQSNFNPLLAPHDGAGIACQFQPSMFIGDQAPTRLQRTSERLDDAGLVSIDNTMIALIDLPNLLSAEIDSAMPARSEP